MTWGTSGSEMGPHTPGFSLMLLPLAPFQKIRPHTDRTGPFTTGLPAPQYFSWLYILSLGLCIPFLGSVPSPWDSPLSVLPPLTLHHLPGPLCLLHCLPGAPHWLLRASYCFPQLCTASLEPHTILSWLCIASA